MTLTPDMEIKVRCTWCGVSEYISTSSSDFALVRIGKFSTRHNRCKEQTDD